MGRPYIFAVLALLFLAGCTPPTPDVRSILPGSSELNVGERFLVRLESTPSTGYLWDVQQPFPTENVQLLKSEVEKKVTRDIVGAPVDQVWVFRCVTPGKVKAVFEYRRPWERVKPLKKNTYALTIKG